jgi:hypothetical protein
MRKLMVMHINRCITFVASMQRSFARTEISGFQASR